jgi:hypothetical protein
MYLLTLAVSFGAIYLAMIYQMNLQPFGFIEPNQNFHTNRLPGWGYSDFFLFTLLGLAVFIGLSFSNLSSKPKIARMLMLPASTFEKYLYPLLLRVMFGVLFFALIFWVDAQLARWTIQGSEKYVLNKYVIVPFKLSMLLDYSPITADNLLLISAVLTSGVFAFVVPLFFKKQALLKTVLAYFGAIFAYACCMVLFSHLLIPGTKGFDVTLNEFQITEQLSSIILMFLILVNLAWVFLLFIGYFKLKEKRL